MCNQRNQLTLQPTVYISNDVRITHSSLKVTPFFKYSLLSLIQFGKVRLVLLHHIYLSTLNPLKTVAICEMLLTFLFLLVVVAVTADISNE